MPNVSPSLSSRRVCRAMLLFRLLIAISREELHDVRRQCFGVYCVCSLQSGFAYLPTEDILMFFFLPSYRSKILPSALLIAGAPRLLIDEMATCRMASFFVWFHHLNLSSLVVNQGVLVAFLKPQLQICLLQIRSCRGPPLIASIHLNRVLRHSRTVLVQQNSAKPYFCSSVSQRTRRQVVENPFLVNSFAVQGVADFLGATVCCSWGNIPLVND